VRPQAVQGLQRQRVQGVGQRLLKAGHPGRIGPGSLAAVGPRGLCMLAGQRLGRAGGAGPGHAAGAQLAAFVGQAAQQRDLAAEQALAGGQLQAQGLAAAGHPRRELQGPAGRPLQVDRGRALSGRRPAQGGPSICICMGICTGLLRSHRHGLRQRAAAGRQPAPRLLQAAGQHRAQAAGHRGQADLALVHRPAPLEHLHLQRPVQVHPGLQAQRGGRRFLPRRQGRQAKTRASLPRALTCRRRICSGRAWGSQASTRAAAWARSSCSVHQSRSAVVCACTQTRAEAGSPHWARPGRCGTWGGPTSTMGRPSAARARATGPSRRHSSRAGWGCSSSVRAPQGQPPPGSSASSAAWPLARTAPRPRPGPGRPDPARHLGRQGQGRRSGARVDIGGRHGGNRQGTGRYCTSIQQF
jgi:hypothetical protein